MSAIRVAIRAGRLERPAWQAEMIAQLRAVPGVEIVETYEPRLLRPADVFIDPTESTVAFVPPGGASAAHDLGALFPRLGIWRFVYGPEGRLTQPCAPEHASGERGTMVRLVAVDAEGRATLLETGVFKVVAHSLGATRDRLFGSVAPWPARALKRLIAEGAQRVRGAPIAVAGFPAASSPGSAGSLVLAPGAGSPAPSASHGLPAGARATRGSGPARFVRNLARRLDQEVIEEHWTVGLIRKPVHHVIDGFDPSQIEWLVPPEGMVLADPVGGVEREGRLTILAEAYELADRQGRIVAFDVHNGRMLSSPREVLRLPVHLSYPHLIFHGGEVYCLPEMSALNRVQLFRADPFPDRWVPDRILLQSFAGADATLCRHAGRWWMFAGDHHDQDETKLFLFHATDLFGPWQPHSSNPVKCDLRSARSAGPLFQHEGVLYRPAQDGSRTYGGAVAVNRIQVLSETEFVEETVNVLRPDESGPYPHGLHTLMGVGQFTLVDGKRHARSFKRLAWGLKQLARARRHPAAPDHGSPQVP